MNNRIFGGADIVFGYPHVKQTFGHKAKNPFLIIVVTVDVDASFGLFDYGEQPLAVFLIFAPLHYKHIVSQKHIVVEDDGHERVFVVGIEVFNHLFKCVDVFAYVRDRVAYAQG